MIYGIILYGGVTLATLVGLGVTAMGLPPTIRDLWGAFSGK